MVGLIGLVPFPEPLTTLPSPASNPLFAAAAATTLAARLATTAAATTLPSQLATAAAAIPLPASTTATGLTLSAAAAATTTLVVFVADHFYINVEHFLGGNVKELMIHIFWCQPRTFDADLYPDVSLVSFEMILH